MPVSKKRKKDGKPVQRKATTLSTEGPHSHGPEDDAAPAGAGRPAAGRPSNPFVAQQSRRASQRGR